MTGERRLLCLMSAWFVGALLDPTVVAGAAFTQSPTDEECTPPSDSSIPVGLHGYRRYFANDSLIGRPVPCTHDDKVCFRHNLVFDPTLDRCMPLGETCGPWNRLRTVNKTELDHGSGRVLGSCPENADTCPGYRMAYDSICYRKEIVRDVICGCDASHTRHFLGGVECRAEPISPISVQQPEEDGSCLIPDLRIPVSRRAMFFGNPFSSDEGPLTSFECDSTQAECFAKETIWVPGHEGCHKLFKQGPCADEHMVALDIQAATQGRAEGTCVHVRGGCPKGHKRMLFDGECHEDREIAIVAPGKIFFNQFGSNVVIDDVSVFNFRIRPSAQCQRCVIQVTEEVPPAMGFTPPSLPPCGNDDKNECKRYEVENDPPKPEI